MAEQAEIERIARDVVNANTAPNAVVSVSSKPSIDWTGDPIVKISIVIEPTASERLVGDAPLDILSGISEGLIAVGEDRFPIIDYATTDELTAPDVDPEP